MIKRIRSFLNKERKKLAGKNRREQLAYIRDYYKIPIAAILCLILLAFYLGHQFRTAVKDYDLYVMFADTRADIGENSSFRSDFLTYADFDPTVRAVEFNAEAWFDYAKDEGRGNRYYELFCGLTDAGVLDAVTMEPDSLAAVGRSGRLMDLTDVHCAALYERFKDRLIYAVPYDEEYSTDPVPIGIDISDCALVSKYHAYEEGCAIGIGANSTRIDAVEVLLNYLYEPEG